MTALPAIYLCNSNVILLDLLSAQSSMIEILLLNSAFYGRVPLSDPFQCFIAKTSTQSYILKFPSISHILSLYIRLIATL